MQGVSRTDAHTDAKRKTDFVDSKLGKFTSSHTFGKIFFC